MKSLMAIKGPVMTGEIVQLDVAARNHAKKLELAKNLIRSQVQMEVNQLVARLVRQALKEFGS